MDKGCFLSLDSCIRFVYGSMLLFYNLRFILGKKGCPVFERMEPQLSCFAVLAMHFTTDRNFHRHSSP